MKMFYFCANYVHVYLYMVTQHTVTSGAECGPTNLMGVGSKVKQSYPSSNCSAATSRYTFTHFVKIIHFHALL